MVRVVRGGREAVAAAVHGFRVRVVGRLLLVVSWWRALLEVVRWRRVRVRVLLVLLLHRRLGEAARHGIGR